MHNTPIRLVVLNSKYARITPMSELIFEVFEAEEGGYWAKALGESIFTEGDTWIDLKNNILEAVQCHFFDSSQTHHLEIRNCTAPSVKLVPS